LVLWSAEEIPGLNEAYGVQQYLPGVLVIGSDGGDDAIALDMTISDDANAWPVVRIGFGNLDRVDLVVQSANFAGWVTSGFRLVPGWWNGRSRGTDSTGTPEL
jgi:hypothetical protein